MKRSSLFLQVFTSLMVVLIVSQPAFAREPTREERGALSSTIQLVADMAALGGDPFGLGDIDYTRIETGDTIPVYTHYADGELSQSNEYFPLYYEGRCIAVCLKQPDGSMGFMTGIANMVQEYFDETGADEVALLYDAKGISFTDGETLTHLGPSSDPERAAALMSDEPISSSQLSSLDVGDSTERISPCADTAESSDDDAGEQANYQSRSLVGNTCSMTYVRKPLGTRICWAACMSMLYGYHGYSYPTAVAVAQYYYNLEPPLRSGEPWDVWRSGEWVAGRLKYHLGLGNYVFHESKTYYQTVKGYIDAGYPFISGVWWCTPSGNRYGAGHMTVLYGYYYDTVTSAKYAMIDDPSTTVGQTYATYYYNPSDNDYYWYYPAGEAVNGGTAYRVQYTHIKIDV